MLNRDALDDIVIGSSSIPNAGRGLFSTHDIKHGDLFCHDVAITPSTRDMECFADWEAELKGNNPCDDVFPLLIALMSRGITSETWFSQMHAAPVYAGDGGPSLNPTEMRMLCKLEESYRGFGTPLAHQVYAIAKSYYLSFHGDIPFISQFICIANHSDEPNARVFMPPQSKLNQSRGLLSVSFLATVDIQSGAEITIDYGDAKYLLI